MRKKYIPCDQTWLDFFSQRDFYKVHPKYPISKINKRQLWNKINVSTVFDMLTNFSQEVWMPITVDKNYNLVDGQHRLQFAEQMCLDYIDVAIYDEQLERSSKKKYNKVKLGIPGWKEPREISRSLDEVLASL